jgi:hypothetical protein
LGLTAFPVLLVDIADGSVGSSDGLGILLLVDDSDGKGVAWQVEQGPDSGVGDETVDR